MERWTVRLPRGVREPYQVYVNGVLQREGVDYEVLPGRLAFSRPLQKEGRLGVWRWFLGAWGIGTYRRNDQVDVAWQVHGQPRVAHALDIEPPGEGPA
jgi:hypothetical protein